MSSKGKKKKDGKEPENLKPIASSHVYKIMNDPVALRHVVLQKACMRALEPNSPVLQENNEVFLALPPINDICLINCTKGDAVPKGYEQIEKSPSGMPAFVLRGTGQKYALCFRRDHSHRKGAARKSRSGSIALPPEEAMALLAVPGGNSDNPRDSAMWNPPSTRAATEVKEAALFRSAPITDIRIAPAKERPFGYEAITHTHAGELILSAFNICFSRTGNSEVKNLAIFHPAKNERAPPGYLYLKENINAGMASDGEEAKLAVAKDISGYFPNESTEDASELVNDPRFLPPLLTACHILEPVLAVTSLLALQALLIKGYFNMGDDGVSHKSLSITITSVCDALGTCSEHDFQREILSVLRIILKKHFNQLSLDDCFDMAVASFRCISTSNRNLFLESFVDMCIREGGAEFNAKSETPEEHIRSLLTAVVDNITHAERTTKLLHVFQVTSISNPQFRKACASAVKLLFTKQSDRQLGILILVLVKISMEPELENMEQKYKYGLARKHSALFTLQRILTLMKPDLGDTRESAESISDVNARKNASDEKQMQGRLNVSASMVVSKRIVMDRSYAFLFRRFMVTGLCQTLAPETNPKNPDVPPKFIELRSLRHLLAIVTILWQDFPHYFKTDLGIMFEAIMVPMAASEHTELEHRAELLNLFATLFAGADSQSIIDLFYNYDNLQGWDLFEQFVEMLGKVAEDSRPVFSNIRKASTMDEKTQDARNRGRTVEFKGNIDDVEAVRQAQNITLSKSMADGLAPGGPSNGAVGGLLGVVGGASSPGTVSTGPVTLESMEGKVIDLVVSVLRNMDQWHAKRLEDRLTKAELDKALAEQEAGVAATPQKAKSRRKVGFADMPDEDTKSAAMNPSESSQDFIDQRNRKGTVAYRFQRQKSDKKMLEKAFRLARTKSLAKAIAHLESLNYLNHDAKEISDFLHKHARRLELEVVGEYLGGNKPIKEDPFGHEVRLQYIRRLQMSNMEMQEALRRFLTESSFRLPKEAQKIERILESFAEVYHQENPGGFENQDGAYVMANAILMLNTSLHNPNLQDRDRLTKKLFISMCLEIPGSHYTAEKCGALFDEIKVDGYEIALTENVTAPAEKRKDAQSSDAKIVSKYARDLRIRVRKAVADLKTLATKTTFFYRAESEETVATQFELTWYQYMNILANTLENASDMTLVARCLEGFKQAFRLCSRLEMKDERQAFGVSLARFTYMYKNALSPNPKPPTILARDLVTGEHTKQVWLEVLNNVTGTDEAAIGIVSSVVDDIQREYLREKNYKELREIQNKLGNDRNLIKPGRYFIREGNIKKTTDNDTSKLKAYRLFLFSDAILYAEPNGPDSYAPHRFILLAFARVDAIGGKEKHLKGGFRLINPQKTVVFFTESSSSRDQWVEAIQHRIMKAKDHRAKVIAAARQCAARGLGGISQSVVVSFEKSAAFLTRDPTLMDRGEAEASTALEDTCVMCTRKYTFFNGKNKCKHCGEFVCSKCIDHTITHPSTGKKLTACDGCYGLSVEWQKAVDKITGGSSSRQKNR